MTASQGEWISDGFGAESEFGDNSNRASLLEAEAAKLRRALDSIVPPPLPRLAPPTVGSFGSIDHVPVGLAELRGRHFVVAAANGAFALLCDAEDPVGRPLGEAAPLAFTHGLADLLDRVHATRSPGALHALRAWGDGALGERFVDVVAQPRGDSIALAITDVTQHVRERRAETARRMDAERRAALLEEERSARTRAEEASRIKDEFLGTLSHELRNPMNAILGWAKVLRRGTLPAEGQARALGVIERSARAQLRLIEDMLDVARIVQGKLVLSTGPLDLRVILQSALEAVRPAADAKGLRLEADLAEGVCIMGDADRIEQAVLNVVTNAVKFTSRGSIRVTLAALNDAAEIAVVDSGCGVSADFLPRMFDRFLQAESGATRTAGGLGVGLAIARSLVDLHGGRMIAASDGLGRGTTVTIRLPASPPGWDEPPPSLTPPPMGPCWTTGKLLDELQVLVVDDDEDARMLAAHLLGDAGAIVTTAASVREALVAAGQGAFDVLVSDVGMPHETGYDLIRALRSDGVAQHAAMPAIAVTAYAREEDRRRALEAGFDGHLAKPVEPAQLVAAVDQVRRVRRGHTS